jgi:hypothetical protein
MAAQRHIGHRVASILLNLQFGGRTGIDLVYQE